MKFHDIQQGTDEWFNLRKGKLTASRFADLFASKTTAAYNKVILQCVYERLTNERPDDFKSAYMERGNEMEYHAVELYQEMTFKRIKNGGFFEFTEWIGASPDGLIDDDGLLQIKSPAWNTHLDYLINKKIPKEYETQVQGEMLCTGRKYCDLMFFHPNLKPVIHRIERNENIIADILNKCDEAVVIIKNYLNKLQ